MVPLHALYLSIDRALSMLNGITQCYLPLTRSVPGTPAIYITNHRQQSPAVYVLLHFSPTPTGW